MSTHWRQIDCPACPATAREPCYAVVGPDDIEYRDPCPARLSAAEDLAFWGVVGLDGKLVLVGDRPYCLTTYKPAAQSAITFAGRGSRDGAEAESAGPLKLKRFKIVPA